MATQTAEREVVSAWIDPRDRERLVAIARTNERSVSAELRLAIREHVERNEAEDDPS